MATCENEHCNTCAQYIVLIKCLSLVLVSIAEPPLPENPLKIPENCSQYPGKVLKVVGRYELYMSSVRNIQISLGLPDPREQSSLPMLKRVQVGIARVVLCYFN